ncbi:MAG: efflux RND transporter permease subunit [Bacteroidetes bacterium]|nr:MAG: efflux RND transporter permease subunit [Bacteroidota bacterium]
MRALISYFIKYPISGNVLLVLLTIFGFLGLMQMRTTFFPDQETRIISIRVTQPGASPEEIEEGIVVKIEENLEGLTGIDRITSVSSENTGRIIVEAFSNYDIDIVLQDVKNAVDQINSFPGNMEPPIVSKVEGLTRAITLALNGDVDLRTLKKFAQDIESDLRAVEGISKINIGGFPEEEIEIALRESDLRAYQLRFEQVALAVSQANLEITGGTIKGNEEELLIRSRAKHYYARELEDIVVTTAPDGRLVRLRDIADVRDRWADVPNRVYVNGNPAVIINVSNTIDEDLLFIADYIKETYLPGFNEKYDAVQLLVIDDASETLQQRIDLLTENGLIGIILVLVLLALFLHIRLAFWVAIGIPISLIGMFIFANQLGLSINIMSLFGMIVVVGILVDDGIVIGENIYRHYEMGKSRYQAAIDGTMEVLPAVFAAVATTVVAFGAFLFLDGIPGDFFGEAALVVVLTLTISLLEGALILPGHVAHSRALSPEAKPNVVERAFTRLMEWMKTRLYAPFLRFFLRNPAFGLAIPIGILIMSFGLVAGGLVKLTFFPFVEFDVMTVRLEMPAGTSERITEDWLLHIEKSVWELNEELKAQRPDGLDVVRKVQRSIDSATYKGSLKIILLDGETRNMSILTFADALRQKVGPIYGANKLVYQIATPFGKAVSLSVKGNNLQELAQATREIKSKIEELKELKDITDSQKEGLREVDIQLKPKAQLLGLSLQQVIGQVRQGFFGYEVQRLQRGEDEVKVWVRYDRSDRSSIGKLEDMRIRTPDGREFPLKELATFGQDRGLIAINRLEGKREVRIEADLASADVSSTDIINTIRDEILPPILAKYPSVSTSFEGQVRETNKTIASSRLVMPIMLLSMFVIVLLTFRSFGQTISVFMLLPFGLIGVILGHWIRGLPISMLSMLGIIALFGIIINDALVMINAFNNQLKEGKPFGKALYEAALSRFRPIVLTSITTIAGLGPLIFETSRQARFLIPMAVSIAFGLLAGTLIILLILPVVLVLLNNFKVYLKWLWEGQKPTPESVEVAVQEMAKTGI